MKTFTVYLYGFIPSSKIKAKDFDDCARKWAKKQGHTNWERGSADCTIRVEYKNESHNYVCWH